MPGKQWEYGVRFANGTVFYGGDTGPLSKKQAKLYMSQPGDQLVRRFVGKWKRA